MKKKITILLTGLLLAVGWTNSAQAQLLPGAKVKTASFDFNAPSKQLNQHMASQKLEAASPLKGQKLNAPRRAQYTEVADVVHPKSWYDQWYYRWTTADGSLDSAYFSEPATTSYQMMTLLKIIYQDPDFPGIKYSKPKGGDHEYLPIDFGWNISGDSYPRGINIELSTSDVRIRSIVVSDQNGNEIDSWTPSSSNYSNQSLPSGWTPSTISGGRSTSYWGYIYYGYIYGGGTINIPSSLLSGKGYTSITVEVNVGSSSSSDDNYIWVEGNDYAGGYYSTTSYTTRTFSIRGGVTPPHENGYTAMIVKLKDEVDFENTQAPEVTTSATALREYFNTYIDEIQLLTDGLRVGQNINGELVDGGTLFSYSGVLNRFFFISKGKMAYISSNENDVNSDGEYQTDRAPFYSMYEEFSPTEQDNTTGIDDFYAKMVAGESYHIKHDCQSVTYMEHFFSMSGKSGTDPKSLSNLVFYIPDYRGTDSTGVAWRNYDINNQPRVGLYTILLEANAVPSGRNDSTYTVTVNWESNLTSIVDNQVPQTYELYEVVYDENGNIVERKLLTTTNDVTTYTYDVDQRPESYTITYQVKGYPTDATNKDTFYAWSNFDDVVIPGWFDFLLLVRDHYESDFVISQLKNFYRNYIYPTNLAPNTGMTIEQLKQEWPEDQIAKYTLYRDDMGIAQLWVRAIGNKVYYKITYIPDTQDTSGPNNININNSNN